MDFSVRCAYAHGTVALRTHLINMVPKQVELTWPAFARLRAKWKGKVCSCVHHALGVFQSWCAMC
jgi:cytosine/creatinine deaminase